MPQEKPKQMKSIEKTTSSQYVANMGLIIKAARKYCGTTQSNLGNIINISQSNISKYENGEHELNAIQWMSFCSHYQIDPNSMFYGKIEVIAPKEEDSPGDFHREVKLRESVAKVGTYKLPARYGFMMGSTVRTAYPFIQLFKRELGEKAFVEFCQSIKMDPFYFVIMSNPINLYFIEDLTQELIRKGILKNLHDFEKIHQVTSFSDFHSHLLHRDLLKINGKPEKLIKSFCRYLNSCYEINSIYQQSSAREIQVQNAEHLKQLNLSNDFKNFRKYYNHSHFIEFSNWAQIGPRVNMNGCDKGWSFEFAA